jgi:hypothetical protein
MFKKGRYFCNASKEQALFSVLSDSNADRGPIDLVSQAKQISDDFGFPV